MFVPLLTRIGAALDRRAIPYMIIGGQAVLVHGEPRLTRDVDITLGIGLEGIDTILDVAADLGLTPLPEDPRAFATQTMVLPGVDDATGIRVDLILSFSTFEREAIARAQPVSLTGGSVRVVTAEDLIVHKLIAGRERDLGDVRSILLRNPGLDRAHVRRWLREFEDGTGLEAGVGPLEMFRRIERSLP